MAAGALIFAIGALAPPHFLGEFVLRLANGGLLLGILALSVAFLMSSGRTCRAWCGQRLRRRRLSIRRGDERTGSVPAGALVASIVIVTLYATILGALIIRTTPLAFMMLTLAAGEMISHGVMLEALRDYTSGADGLVVSFNGTLFGLQAGDFANSIVFWPVVWSAAWIAGIAVWAVRRSRLGGVLSAIRGNEERMRFSGFDTYLPRLVAFVFVNVIAGFCGILHVLNSGFVSPESLGLGVSTNALVAALIGGAASSTGPIVGGLIFVFAQDQFGARGFTQLLTGVAIVVFIVLFPSGVVGALGTVARRVFHGRNPEVG